MERAALSPDPVEPEGFNPDASLPYGLTTEHIRATMHDFVEFLGFINQQMHTRDIERLEAMLMPANFSSIVGEFMNSGIPKHCPTLVKNQYHNGHPDLLPFGMFPDDAAQHAQPPDGRGERCRPETVPLRPRRRRTLARSRLDVLRP
jgi:hypothetical protein